MEYFRDVVAPLGGQVVTTNSVFYAAGFLTGDRRYVVPPIDDPTYIPTLLKIVEHERVELVLPLFDIDLLCLSRARRRFREIGAEVVIGDPDVIEIANDKWRTYTFLTEHGISTPRTWLTCCDAELEVMSGIARFPLIVKPRYGMGSIGVRIVSDINALRESYELTLRDVNSTYIALISSREPAHSVLVQEHVSGVEYGADVLNDLSGTPLAAVVKQKLSSRPEGADFAVTTHMPQIEMLCLRIAKLLRHRGNLDIDIMQPKAGPAVVIELNARFGGGYPFSHLAGARFPRAIVQMVRGETPDPGTVEIGMHGFLDIVPRRLDESHKSNSAVP